MQAPEVECISKGKEHKKYEFGCAARKQREEETGKKTPGRPPEVVKVEEAKPKPKAQRNFTDPESRIMKDGATGSFEQSYNAQIAVDGQAQIIVATTLTQAVNDKQQLVPVWLRSRLTLVDCRKRSRPIRVISVRRR
jgi:hypothetical protein